MHKTHLYNAHVAAGARMVDFVGWNIFNDIATQMDVDALAASGGPLAGII